MNEFLEQVWLDNPVRNYLLVAAVILFVVLLRRFISKFLAGLLYRLLRTVWKDIDKAAFVKLVIRPLGFFLVILVSLIALHNLRFPEVLDVEVYRITVKEILHAIGTIVLIVSFFGFMLRTIDFVALILGKRADLTPDHSDNQLIVFFKDFFKVVLVIIAILMTLKFAFGFNIGSLLTGLGIVGAAIALSLRESLENLIASFIIFFDKPFTTGDSVKVQQVSGSVERIGLRSTRIRTSQKTYVTVPNKQMVDSILDNITLRTQQRGELRIEAAVNTPPAKIESLLAGIRRITGQGEMEESTVHLSEITSTAVVVIGEYFTAPVTTKEFNRIREDVNMQCLKLMEVLNIEMAGSRPDLEALMGVKRNV